MARIIAFFRGLALDAADGWKRLSLDARVKVAMTLVVLAVLMTVVLVVGSRPQYVRLHANLAPDDAATIQSYLEDQGIPYRFRANGTAIDVPSSKRTQAMVDLAAQGVPAKRGSGIGFEIFDTQDFMADRYIQDIRHQRAIRGEIVRTLESMDFVKRADVQITNAKDRLFAKEQQPSKAAVTVELTRDITDEQISALVNIIAYAGGPHLTPDNVVLATTGGEFLHKPSSDSFTALASTQLEHQNNTEAYYRNKIKRFLEESGQPNASVGVSASVSYDTIKEISETNAEGAVISRLNTTTENTTTESLPTGSPGASANPPEEVGTPRTTVSETQEEIWENMEPTRTSIERQTPPGAVSKIRVAVTLDQKLETEEPVLGETPEEGVPAAGEARYVPWTEDELEHWQAKIAHVAGTDVAPEDVVVDDYPFTISRTVKLVEAQAESAGDGGFALGRLWDYSGQAAKVLAVILGIIIIIRLARSLPIRRGVDDLGMEEHLLDPEEYRRRQVTDTVEGISRDHPEQVASLLRSWIGETEEQHR